MSADDVEAEAATNLAFHRFNSRIMFTCTVFRLLETNLLCSHCAAMTLLLAASDLKKSAGC